MKAFISALGLLLATAGCMMDESEGMGARGARVDRQPAMASGARVQQVGEAQNGSTITLPVGGELIVALKGNRTTGYAWEVGARPGNLSLSDKGYQQDAAPAGMVGVGGTETFKFRANRVGSGPLRLDHVGAGGRGVAESWQVTIIVQ